jgi:hypothetical protein
MIGITAQQSLTDNNIVVKAAFALKRYFCFISGIIIQLQCIIMKLQGL